ncbi:hypothetical protein [Salinimonas iocasae]|uniref:Peptidase M61 catalytic domain-containing protein n=1 Tax=Salinimonas iocasae TaxID=2572577 RepID=A0A5B7Y8Z9_9ALTE|nr:hypothetical protein [Salinimonas iocasae]QCZ92134.1 hypothetical protein FBQ74_00985 [Salinimonas iocasae]
MKVIAAFYLMLISSFAWATSESMVDIAIEKSNYGEWTVSYKMHRPASRLSFIRNPDDSRTKRWHPEISEFEIVSIGNHEYIVRTDGKDFTEVSMRLTPTYTHLPKDYAPFSPYSEHGVLFHTGRFFACIDECSDNVNEWFFTLKVPENEHMIVNGKVLKDAASWKDSNNGMNIYVGSQEPVETQNVISVIDNGLPESMKRSLNSVIPELMNYYESRLGKLDGAKPTLFASYANTSGHSTQGGTLPNQIFMHWDLNNLHGKANDDEFLNDTVWFFAHEVAHLYQRADNKSISGKKSESWLHEGHAEWLAALALLEVFPDKKEYVANKINRLKTDCSSGLTDISLVEAADKGRIDLHYSCGLLIHQAIDTELEKSGKRDIYSLWVDFRERARKGNEEASDVFLSLTETWTSKTFVKNIEQILEGKLVSLEESLSL